MRDNKNVSFEAFQLVMKEQFNTEIEDYADLLNWISIIIDISSSAMASEEYAEKEYEKLVEENNKLLSEIGELKDKIKEG